MPKVLLLVGCLIFNLVRKWDDFDNGSETDQAIL